MPPFDCLVELFLALLEESNLILHLPHPLFHAFGRLTAPLMPDQGIEVAIHHFPRESQILRDRVAFAEEIMKETFAFCSVVSLAFWLCLERNALWHKAAFGITILPPEEERDGALT